MTRRERLEMVIANNITEELIEECKVELEKLNASNASRKPTAHQVENVKIGENILTILSDEPKFVEDVLAGLDGEFTRQRVSRSGGRRACRRRSAPALPSATGRATAGRPSRRAARPP